VAGDTEPPGHLRGGDEEAFGQLARRHHASMVCLAAAYVAGRALAGQAARDTWLDALEGIDGRGGLEVKAWLFRLLAGRAAAAGARGDRPPAGDPAAGPGRGRRGRRLGLPAAALARRCRAAAAPGGGGS